MMTVYIEYLYGKTEQESTIIIWKQFLNVLFLPVTSLVYSAPWQRLQIMITFGLLYSFITSSSLGL